MTKFNIFLPLLFSVASIVALFWFLNQPTIIWYLPLFFILASLYISWSFCRQAKNYFGWWQFAILPALANITVLAYLVIIADTDVLIIYLLSGVLTVFNYLYCRYLYFYLNNAGRYQPFSLEFLSFYLSYGLVFLAAAFLYGLKSFMNYNAWLILSLAAGFLALIIYQFNWIGKYNHQRSRAFLLTVWIILVELFAVLLFLPLHYNILGFIFSIGYYLLIVIAQDCFKDKLTVFRLKIYIGVSLITVALTLISARWL